MAQRPRRKSKPRKKVRPQVIDLEAQEVTAEDAPESAESTAAEAMVENDQPQDGGSAEDETSVAAGGGAGESAATGEGEPEADAEAKGDEATPAEADGANGAGKADEAGGGGGSTGKLIAAGIAALFIAGGAWAWAYKTYGGGADAGPQIAALEQQLAELRKSNETYAQKLSKLEATIAGEQKRVGLVINSIEQAGAARAEKMQAALDDLTATIKSAGDDGTGGAAGQAANTMKIEELQGSLDAVSGKLTAIEGKVEAGSGSEVEALKAQMQAVSQTLEAMKAQQDARATQTVSALGQSFGQLSAAVAGSAPFEAQLDALVATAPTLPGIADLRDMAKSGVPSSAALADELDGLAAAVQKAHEAAAVTASEEGGVLSALTSQLTKVVKIRKVGEIDWVELLTQSAQKVRGGDLASVVKTLSAGGEGAPDGVAGWLEKANARLALDGAMDKLSKAVLRQLAATGKSG
jgi:hypothetical protein